MITIYEKDQSINYSRNTRLKDGHQRDWLALLNIPRPNLYKEDFFLLPLFH
jgi:hypothetical protein